MDSDSDNDDNNVISEALEEKKVIERILSFLPPCEIKTMRLVSKFWSKVGAKKLVEKCFLRATSCLPKKPVNEEKKLQAITKFSQFLKLSGSPEYLKVVCERNDCSKMMEIMNEVPELRNSTRELKFNGGVSSLIKDLAQLVKKLPFIDFLYTSTMNLNLAQFDATNNEKKKKDNSNNNSDDSDLSEDESKDEEKYSKDDFDMFLERLKDLDELHLEHFIRTDVELGDYLTHRKNLKALKSLSLITSTGSTDNIPRERSFLSTSYKYWKITHLTWKLDRKISKGLIHNFILNFAPTLKYLNMTIGKEQDEVSPWIDDWYIPYNLPHLTVFKIDGHAEHVKSGIFIALQITSLEKISIKNVTSRLDISNWTYHSRADGRKLCSQSIKEVELDKVEWYTAEFLLGSLWPNVKSVKVGNIIFKSWGMSSHEPFKNSKNIEHLEFDVSDVSAKNFSSYELWMAGVAPTNLYKSGEVLTRSVGDSFRLRDLEHLKSLKINGAGYIGDFFIFNCFQDFRNLQRLYLKGARISQTAYDELQKQLGPSTSILITN